MSIIGESHAQSFVIIVSASRGTKIKSQGFESEHGHGERTTAPSSQMFFMRLENVRVGMAPSHPKPHSPLHAIA
jgi:hypothetical protein